MRLRGDSGSIGRSDRLRPGAQLDGSEQRLEEDADSPASPQHSVSASSTLGSPAGSEEREAEGLSQSQAALYAQLELLHQECQEKEALINKLSEQLADWEQLHGQLLDKERLNGQLLEALQASESTIAYLTACSLDGQAGLGSRPGPQASADAAFQSRLTQLQNALREKEELNKQLIELLSMAEKAVASSEGQDVNPEASDLCLKIETALQQASTPPSGQSGGGGCGDIEELQRRTDSLQEALWQQNRLNAELQEKLRAAEEERTSQEATGALQKCLSAAESAVAALATHCSSSAAARGSQSSSDLQLHLDALQRALQERRELGGPGRTSSDSTPHHDLHSNLCRLYKAVSEHLQRASELQAERSLREDKGLPPSVQAQLETLHKALREKKKACKSLEEKLATALTSSGSPEAARKGECSILHLCVGATVILMCPSP